MHTANFSWQRVDNVIALIDAGNGRSITNDAEGVVTRLRRDDDVKLTARDRIFYRDTLGQWDELLHDGAHFTGYAALGGARTLEDALRVSVGVVITPTSDGGCIAQRTLLPRNG